jgi:superfamily II DNA/RNA helicase
MEDRLVGRFQTQIANLVPALGSDTLKRSDRPDPTSSISSFTESRQLSNLIAAVSSMQLSLGQALESRRPLGLMQRFQNINPRVLIEMPSASLLDALWKVTGSSRPKSTSQYYSLVHLTSGDPRHLLCVLPTGGGKSAVFLAAALLEAHHEDANVRKRVTVIILPLKSLMEDIKRRARDVGLRIAVWNPDASANHVHILLVTIERASHPKFQAMLETLHSQDELARIVVDEVHVIWFDRDFRTKSDSLGYLATVGVPIIGLTATLPPSEEQNVTFQLGWNSTQYVTLREPTTRPNLAYQYMKFNGSDEYTDRQQFLARLAKHLTSLVKPERFPPGCQSRAILFYSSRELLKEIVELTNWQNQTTYHALAPEDEKPTSVEDWDKGVKPIMHATSAFGLGVDFPFVDLVIHVGLPFGLIDYMQQAGRAGRAGQQAACCLLYWAPLRPSQNPSNGANDLINALRDNKQCLRFQYESYLDGSSVPCLLRPDAALCDRCATVHAFEVDESIGQTSSLSHNTVGTSLTQAGRILKCKPNNEANSAASVSTKQTLSSQPSSTEPLNKTLNVSTPSDSQTSTVSLSDSQPTASLNSNVDTSNLVKNSNVAPKSHTLILIEAFQYLRSKCVWCWMNKLDPSRHFLDKCEELGSVRIQEKRKLIDTKRKKDGIQFPKFTTCYNCFLPFDVFHDSVVQNSDQGASSHSAKKAKPQCFHPNFARDILWIVIWSGERRWRDAFCREFGKQYLDDASWDMEMTAWLPRKEKSNPPNLQRLIRWVYIVAMEEQAKRAEESAQQLAKQRNFQAKADAQAQTKRAHYQLKRST